MDLNETLLRLEAARGDPNALALATIDIVLESREAKLADVLAAAAVPHWFDESLLRSLVSDRLPEASDWFDQLTSLTVVERFQAHTGWNIHEVTRLALRQRLFAEHPERFRELSARAAAEIDNGTSVTAIEHVYHLLSCTDEGAARLRELWVRWSRAGQFGPLQALGKTLDELLATDMLAPRSRAYALVALGVIREDRIPLPEWEGIGRQSIELMTSIDDALGLVDAYHVLGKALRAQGRLGDSIAAYEQARVHLERWGQGASDERQMAEVRANLHQGVGRTLLDRGHAREALQEFEAVMAIRQRLCDVEPDDDLNRHELAVAHADVGDALLSTSRADESERHYHRALAIVQSRENSSYGTDANDQDAAALKVRLGDVLKSRGNVNGALREFEAAETITDRLTTRDPDHLGWRGMLANVRMRVGNVRLGRGELEEADARFSKAREMYRALAERDGANPEWKRALGDMGLTFGVLREQQKRWPDAASEYIEAERLLRELSASDPAVVAWKTSHVEAQNGLGRLLQKVGQALDEGKDKVDYLSRAVVLFDSARKSLAELVQRDTDNASWQSSLAWTNRLLASAMETLADFAESGFDLKVEMSVTELRECALNAYTSSVRTLSVLTERAPQNTDYRHDLSITAARAGGVLEKLGKRADALIAYRSWLLTSEQLLAVDATNTNWAENRTAAREAIARLGGESDGTASADANNVH